MTIEGGYRAAAKRLGVSSAFYALQRANGLRWCSYHAEWHPAADFCRPDASYCRAGVNEWRKAKGKK